MSIKFTIVFHLVLIGVWRLKCCKMSTSSRGCDAEFRFNHRAGHLVTAQVKSSENRKLSRAWSAGTETLPLTQL